MVYSIASILLKACVQSISIQVYKLNINDCTIKSDVYCKILEELQLQAH